MSKSTKAIAWQVYANQLSQVDRGRAMWLPELPKPEVTIGDVGWIDQGIYTPTNPSGFIEHRTIESGEFRRLFNVTKPPDDELNKRFKPPDNYQILEYNSILEADTPNYIQTGHICSKSVKSFNLAPHAGGGAYVLFAHDLFE